MKFPPWRPRRFNPLYIASVLLFVPVWLLASPGIEWNMAGWTGVAMLTGVRASPEVFGLLNPSWWFFWTILQLMLLFLMLVWLANRIGYWRLFLLALLLTLITRAYVLHTFQSTGQQNLWPLLTGVFAATRLAEFVFGMWVARQLSSHRVTVERIVSRRGLAVSMGLLVLGVGLSLFVYGGTAAACRGCSQLARSCCSCCCLLASHIWATAGRGISSRGHWQFLSC